MDLLASIWGLTLAQTVLLLAAILVVLDFFLPTDAPTHLAYVLLCFLVAIKVPGHMLVRILCGLLAWFVLIVFHYCIWRATVQRIVDKFIAPDKYQTGSDGIVGHHGVVRIVDGIRMASLQGDLWPCQGAENLQDGEVITVRSSADGILHVTKG